MGWYSLDPALGIEWITTCFHEFGNQDEEKQTPPLEQAKETTSSILQDLKAYLDKRDIDPEAYLSQKLAIKEDLMEEKLRSLIDPKISIQKTERQASDDESPPVSEEDYYRSINRLLQTATLDKPHDEDPATSLDEDLSSRSKRASGRVRPEQGEREKTHRIETLQACREAPQVQRK